MIKIEHHIINLKIHVFIYSYSQKMRSPIFSVGIQCMCLEVHIFRGVQRVDMVYL